jgi:hypothetical protein
MKKRRHWSHESSRRGGRRTKPVKSGRRTVAMGVPDRHSLTFNQAASLVSPTTLLPKEIKSDGVSRGLFAVVWENRKGVHACELGSPAQLTASLALSNNNRTFVLTG